MTSRSVCPPLLPHQAVARTSPLGVPLLASPSSSMGSGNSSNGSQSQVQTCFVLIIPQEPRGTGLGFSGHCSTAAARAGRAQHGSTSRGYKKPQPLCTRQVDTTCLLPGGRGTFQAVFSSWRAGRGGSLLQAATDYRSELAAHPPTHPQTRRPVLLLEGANGRTCLCLQAPKGQDGSAGPVPGMAGPGAVSAGRGQCPWALSGADSRTQHIQ